MDLEEKPDEVKKPDAEATQLAINIETLTRRFETLESRDIEHVKASEINGLLERLESLEQKAVKLSEKSDTIEVLSLITTLKKDIKGLTDEQIATPTTPMGDDEETRKRKEIDSFPMGI